MAGGNGRHRARHHAAMRTSSRSAGAASKPLITLVAVMLAAAACSPLALSSPGAVPVPSTPPSIAPRITASPATVEPSPSPSPSPSSAAVAADDLRLPPPNAGFDYQLGGAYPPPPGVTVVSRDRTASPEPGLFNICYVNGFQVQPGEEGWWRANHPDLHAARRQRQGRDRPRLGRDDARPDDGREARPSSPASSATGSPGARPMASTPSRSTTSTPSPGPTAASARTTPSPRCACSPMPPTPTASRSRRRTRPRSPAGARRWAPTSRSPRNATAGTECDAYTGAYGDHVLVIEYRRRDFAAGCAAYPGLSIILRDLDLVPPADKGYVYRTC